MPVHYRYDAASRRLSTRCDGDVRLNEVVGHFRELTKMSGLCPDSDVLLDFTFQSNMPPVDKVHAAASVLEELKELLRFGRCAMVAPGDIPGEIARRFQAVSWPLFRGTRIFANHGEATRWLDEIAENER